MCVCVCVCVEIAAALRPGSWCTPHCPLEPVCLFRPLFLARTRKDMVHLRMVLPSTLAVRFSIFKSLAAVCA